ncbi:MAG TPA: hypothetical protein PKY59_26895 [Pyrinomonadaceae bacterium]|nr:hypothetical protein [Pyrinomonadaceae bacterium]
MKPKSFLNIALLLCLTLVFGQQIFAQKTDKTALKQDLTKLKDLLGKYGTITNADNPRVTYKLRPLEFNGCQIKFGYMEIENRYGNAMQPEARNAEPLANATNSVGTDWFLYSKYRYLVNIDLAKLDPASIKLNAEKLEFGSLDSQKAIKQTVAGDTKKLSASWIPVVNTDENDEVLSVFTNVARQCQAG